VDGGTTATALAGLVSSTDQGKVRGEIDPALNLDFGNGYSASLSGQVRFGDGLLGGSANLNLRKQWRRRPARTRTVGGDARGHEVHRPGPAVVRSPRVSPNLSAAFRRIVDPFGSPNPQRRESAMLRTMRAPFRSP
jgi:hypothetical protein